MSLKRLRHLVELPSSDKAEVLTLFKYQNHKTYLDYVRMHLSFVLDLPTDDFAPLLDTDYFKETRFSCPPLKGKETKGEYCRTWNILVYIYIIDAQVFLHIYSVSTATVVSAKNESDLI